jgi:hypothetical protein
MPSKSFSERNGWDEADERIGADADAGVEVWVVTRGTWDTDTRSFVCGDP